MSWGPSKEDFQSWGQPDTQPWETQAQSSSSGTQAQGNSWELPQDTEQNVVKTKADSLAIIDISSSADPDVTTEPRFFGGGQFKAGDEKIFEGHSRVNFFIQQTGASDHPPRLGFTVSIDHGELRTPHTGTYFEVQNEVKPTTTYNLTFTAPLHTAKLSVCGLSGSTAAADGKLELFPDELVPTSIIEANKNGMCLMSSSMPSQLTNNGKQGADLVAILVSLNGDNQPDGENKPDGETKLGLLNYPPCVADGPNYRIVHHDEPFDYGATITTILDTTVFVVYVPRARFPDITNAFIEGKKSPLPNVELPYGLPEI